MHPKLAIALQWREFPICIETNPASTPSACIRTSNSKEMIELSDDEADDILSKLRNAARVEPNGRSTASASVDIDGRLFRLNICPQLNGSIFTLRKGISSKAAVADPSLQEAGQLSGG